MSILTGCPLKMLRRLFSRSRFSDSTHALHQAVVGQARRPCLYRRFAIPDTFDGRFEFLVLHVLLVMRRLRSAGATGGEVSQELFDLVFADLDRALREIGVGDLRVGSRIRRMAEAFFGRARALDDALAPAAADAELKQMLARNVYGTVKVPGETIERLADYVRQQAKYLVSIGDRIVLEGRFGFDDPESR